MATYTANNIIGLWSAGSSWVGGVKPPSGAGHKISIPAAADITYDEAAGTYGDDISSLTPSACAITVLGILRFSRAVSTQITARGTLAISSGGRIDIGTSASPIPAGVTCTVILNDSAVMAAGKHGLVSYITQAVTGWSIRGVNRTRNTFLSAPTSANATTLQVDNSSNWEIGDELVLATDVDSDIARSQTTFITGGSSPNWTVSPAITNARLAGCEVGNLSSNVVIKAANTLYPAIVGMGCASSGNFSVFDVGDARFENIGGPSGWAGLANIPLFFGLGIGAGGHPTSATAERLAIKNNGNNGNALLSTTALSRMPGTFNDCAVYVPINACAVFYAGDNSKMIANDTVVYRAGILAVCGFSAGAIPGILNRVKGWIGSYGFSVSSGKFVLNDSELYMGSALVSNGAAGVLEVNNSVLMAPRIAVSSLFSSVQTYLKGCTYQGNTLIGDNTLGSNPAAACTYSIVSVDNNIQDNRDISYFRVCTTDLAISRRSTYAVKIQPKVASTPITYVFAIPAVSGVAQVIKGSLRFDTTYGTATPPSIVLAGQGVSQSFTAPASADAWHDFSFSFTPTSTGDITTTVTVQSASITGFAWLDGIYHFPMTQSVRHFGYLWQPQANQVADPSITVSEAAALAYPVAVNHAAPSITISANATTKQVYEACVADLVQTANQGIAKHISTNDGGDSFTTTYPITINTGVTVTGSFTTTGAVTLSGTADVAGVYTDSTGRHVKVKAPNIIAGSRVQLYDGATQLADADLASTGFSLALVHTTDKTLTLKAGYAIGTVAKKPIIAQGVLTAAGLTFTNTQVDDLIYNEISVNGGTCTEFTPAFPNLALAAGSTTVQRLYAWAAWSQTSSLGMQLMFDVVRAFDSKNIYIDQSIVDARLENTGETLITGGNLTRLDGTTVIAAGSSIQIDPGKAYTATDLQTLIRELALLHGLITPLIVSATTRSAGTVTQSIATVDGTTTVTRT